MTSIRSQPGFGLQRIYEETHDGRGYRVLVDRLWPRGIKKEDAAVDEWNKDIAPSTELRRWYGHDPARFEEFARRYRDELSRPPASDAVARLQRLAREQRVVLVTATRDVDRSGGQVLYDHLRAPS